VRPDGTRSLSLNRHQCPPQSGLQTPARYPERVRFVLTNDDGIDAPGIAAMAAALEGLGEVWTVAPATGMSGCAHSATEGTFRVFELGPRRYAVEGTPVDCTRVAIHLLRGKLDWVVSGINDGGNLGVDVYHSGTVAAVREAVMRGIPGFAISHFRDRNLTEKDWKRAARWAREVFTTLTARPHDELGYWNVNLPCPPEAVQTQPPIAFCELDPAALPLEYLVDGNVYRYHGRYTLRERHPGADVEACFGGKIAVSYVLPGERCAAEEAINPSREAIA
jgi:5'-nucleotidase